MSLRLWRGTSRVRSRLVNLTGSRIREYNHSHKMADVNYTTWDAEQLVEKVKALERELKETNARYRALAVPSAATIEVSPKREKKTFDPANYSTRMIALKFAYLGQNYNGLEYTPGNVTPLPTVEEALWAALMTGKLILPTDEEAIAAGKISWAGCDYTKCGRTDKGVSAFGQVISLRVRSNRPLPGRRKKKPIPRASLEVESGVDGVAEQEAESPDQEPPFDPVKDELDYVHILNQLLPSDIRVLAWCSDLPEDFNARFSCRERRYRYTFTNPAFAPTFGSRGLALSRTIDTNSGTARREGWLDIAAMQDAAKRYEGLHDFRNFCKIDSSKQLLDHNRRIFRSEIKELELSELPAAYVGGQAFSEFEGATHTNGTHSRSVITPKTYQFILHGSAFLWHQVRHMVAVLFLVGQGLETPDIVDKLMDGENCPCKPHYEMADDAPLVLWDCIFPDLDGTSREDSLKWIYAGDGAHHPNKGKYHSLGLVDRLWAVWRKRKIDEVLAGSLLNLVVGQGQNVDLAVPARKDKTNVYLGGNTSVCNGNYVPLLERRRGEHFEVVNARYAERKGLIPKTREQLQEIRDARRDKRHDHIEEITA